MAQEKKEKQEQNKEEANKESWLAKFKKMDTKRKIQYAVILLITIVILAIFFGTSGTSNAPPADNAPTINQDVSSDSIEQKLKETLSKIDGAGRVEVMITYESSAILNPAISVDTQSTTTQDEYDNGNSVTESMNTQSEVVTVSGSNGNQALVLSEQSPEIKGVIVIAEGANDISVRLNLLSAVQTVLNVEPEKVDVYKMNIE